MRVHSTVHRTLPATVALLLASATTAQAQALAGLAHQTPTPARYKDSAYQDWVVGLEAGSKAESAKLGMQLLGGPLAHDGHSTCAPLRTLRQAMAISCPPGLDVVTRLRFHKTVRFVERDTAIPISARAWFDDEYLDEAWHLNPDLLDTRVDRGPIDTRVSQAWDHSLGDGAIIAIIDDGFDLSHPDLDYLAGKDFSRVESADDSATDDPSYGGGDWHGTQTAGVAAAMGDNSIGTSGSCPRCKILPVRLIGQGGPDSLLISGSAIAGAIEWAVEQGADVINNSWGPPDGNPFDPQAPREKWPRADGERPAGVLQQVIQEALYYAAHDGRGGLGTPVVWSSGNGGELISYDGFAADPRVLAIGSVDTSGQRAYYSDYGPELFAVMPSSGRVDGPKIFTTDISGSGGLDAGDYTDAYGGTSAAAAMFSGAIALLISHHPTLTVAQLKESLAQTARYPEVRSEAEEAYYTRYHGYGLIDVQAAMVWAESYTGACSVATEICANGIDDDCDGVVDNPDACQRCLPTAGREVCDAGDANCDGRVNEGFVCSTARPACAPCDSSEDCAAEHLCRAAIHAPGAFCLPACTSDITCPNGSVCDGQVCQLLSTFAIDALSAELCAGILCEPESCDGIDNNCDGNIDENIPESQETESAKSQCIGAGVCSQSSVSCEGGSWRCELPANYEWVESLCDGLDNDCDGTVDEHCPPKGCTCEGVSLSSSLLWVGVVCFFGRRRRAQRPLS